MAINPSDIPVLENTPSIDLSTPPGFTPLIIWAYDELFQLPTNPLTETVSCQVIIPTQLTAVDWQGFFQTIRSQLSTQGYDIVAYGVWEQPALNITVPDQLCFAGTSTCLTIPNQICFPLIGCINLAGSTLVSAWTYQVWVLVYAVGQTAGYALDGVRGMARGQLQLAIAVILLIFGVIIGVVGLQAVETGKLTVPQLQGIMNQWLTAPGQNLATAEAGLAWPFAVMGAVMVIGSVTAGALAVSGNLNLPGGVGVGGGFSTGGASAPSAETAGRRRR
jgi:hypothetical protein